MFLPHNVGDVMPHDCSLFAIAVQRLINKLFAEGIFAERCFGNLPLVVANEAIGRLNNILRRTIVLLQLKELALRIDVLKVKNVINVRTTKTINALRIVAYHTDVLLLAGELRDNLLLHGVGVLKLIDQHIAETRSIFLADVFVFMK